MELFEDEEIHSITGLIFHLRFLFALENRLLQRDLGWLSLLASHPLRSNSIATLSGERQGNTQTQ